MDKYGGCAAVFLRHKPLCIGCGLHLGTTISALCWTFTPMGGDHRNEGAEASVPGEEKGRWRTQSRPHCFCFSLPDGRPWGLQDVFTGQLQTKSFFFSNNKGGNSKDEQGTRGHRQNLVYLSFKLHFLQRNMLRKVQLIHLGMMVTMFTTCKGRPPFSAFLYS